MGSVSVQLGLLAIAKDGAHDTTEMDVANDRATAAGHRVMVKQVVADTEAAIRETLTRWIADRSIDAIVVLGGAESDAVSSAMKPLVTAQIPGFTDLFRWLMFQEQGASAMLSSAEAARCSETFVFVIPGAVGAAMDKLILPQFDPDASGKNLLKQLPRLRTDVDADAAVPQEIKPEKTQGGSGMQARLPAPSSGARAQAHSTGKHVVARGVVPKDPDTAPIDLNALERNLAASTADTDTTKQTDLQKMLPKLPPGATPEPDDVTKTDMLAAPPTPSRTQSKGVDLAAKLASVPNVPPVNRQTPVPVTINPRKRTEAGSNPPATPNPDAKTPNPDQAARARRASASLPKSGAPTTVRTKAPTEPPRRGAGVFSTQMSASPPMPPQKPAMLDAKTTIDPKPTMLEAATTVAPQKGMLGADTVIALTPAKTPRPPTSSGEMPLELDEDELETIDPDEHTGRFAKTQGPDPDEQETRRADRVSASVLDEAPTTRKSESAPKLDAKPAPNFDAKPAPSTKPAPSAKPEQPPSAKPEPPPAPKLDAKPVPSTKPEPPAPPAKPEPAIEARPQPKTRPPTKPPPAKVTLPPKNTSDDAFAATEAQVARALPDDLPKERRNSGGLPRGTFNYPTAKKGMHPAVKIAGLLAVVGLGFGAVVFAFREKKPDVVATPGSGSTEKVADVSIDASVPVNDVDDTKTDDTQSGDSKSGDSKSGDTQSGDTKSGDSKTGDSKTGAKTGDTKTGDTKTGATKPGDTKTGVTKPGDTKTGVSKPGDTKTGDTKTGDTKSGDTKTGDTTTAVTPPDDDCDETACVASNYDKPCCAKYKPKGPEIAVRTESGLPKQLDRTGVRAGIDGVRARITTCGEKSATKGTVKVHVTVSPEGAVTESSVEEAPDDSLGKCVATAMKSAKFGKSEEGGSFSYPFVF